MVYIHGIDLLTYFLKGRKIICFIDEVRESLS